MKWIASQSWPTDEMSAGPTRSLREKVQLVRSETAAGQSKKAANKARLLDQQHAAANRRATRRDKVIQIQNAATARRTERQQKSHEQQKTAKLAREMRAQKVKDETVSAASAKLKRAQRFEAQEQDARNRREQRREQRALNDASAFCHHNGNGFYDVPGIVGSKIVGWLCNTFGTQQKIPELSSLEFLVFTPLG